MKYFLPLLFLTYWGGVTLFTHSHVVNGVIIVHSHPFKTGHQHTESQAETIFFLDHYVASSVPVLLLPFPASVPCWACWLWRVRRASACVGRTTASVCAPLPLVSSLVDVICGEHLFRCIYHFLYSNY